VDRQVPCQILQSRSGGHDILAALLIEFRRRQLVTRNSVQKTPRQFARALSNVI
jgi:hypothetical protein